MTINWSVFTTSVDNYSALAAFRFGFISVRELVSMVDSDAARYEARRLKYIPVRNARMRARKALNRMNVLSLVS